MKAEGLGVDQRAPHDSPARGEAVVIQRGGGRFVTIACDSDVYHSVADAGRKQSLSRMQRSRSQTNVADPSTSYLRITEATPSANSLTSLEMPLGTLTTCSLICAPNRDFECGDPH
jgi:hypothetical protein